MENEIQEETVPVVVSPVIYKFTNRAESNDLDMLLKGFYQGAYSNAIGIMEAYNLDTESVDVLIVGVQLDENGKPDCYPLARALTTKEMHRYLSPDGEGRFYDSENAVENSAVKERMRPYQEAVEDLQDDNVEALGVVFNG